MKQTSTKAAFVPHPLGKYTWISKDAATNRRSVTVANSSYLGPLSDCRSSYYKTFSSYERKAGAFILVDSETGQQFVGSGESILDELEKLAASHAKPAPERSALENAVASNGAGSLSVQVVPLPHYEASEVQALVAELIRDCKPQSAEEESSVRPVLNLITDDPSDPDFWMSGGDLTIIAGPTGVMLMNTTRDLYRMYHSDVAASVDLEISLRELQRLVEEHGGKLFTLPIAEINDLRRANYKELKRAAKA